MVYYLDDLTIDITRKKVLRSQQCLNVSGLNYRFLSFMLTKNTTVVTFDELIDSVWSPTIVNEETVTQRVRLLRRALGDNGHNPRYIRSVRGQGYQLVAQSTVDIVKLIKPSAQINRARPFVWLTACVLVLCLSFLSGLDRVSRFNLFKEVSNRDSTDKFMERAVYYASIGQQDDNDRAIELYQRVLLTESKNTKAMIGLSHAYTMSMCRFNADWSRAEHAEVLARKVIAIEPNNFNALRVLGYSQDCRGQSLAAREAYLQAIELDPNNDVKSQSSLAYLLGESGELAKALTINLFVQKTDPEQTFSLIQIGRIYELLGLYSRAEALYAESFELYPDNILSNLSYPRHLFLQGRFLAARKIVTRAKTRPLHPDLLVLSAELALLDNDTTQANSELLAATAMRPSSEHLELLVKLYSTVQQPSGWLSEKLAALKAKPESSDPEDWLKQAMIYQALGEEQSGINALLAAVKSGYRNKGYLKLSPFFTDLRSRPEFSAVIERIELAVKHELDSVLASGLLAREVAEVKHFNTTQAKDIQTQTPTES